MGTKSPGGSQRCRLILHKCLAIQLCKSGDTPEDFWMYDSGYMIFQNFLAANAQCWWNSSLTAATRSIKYAGHVAPGMLLVTGEPCALEVLRGTYARGVLKPPATYVISSVGDIDDCIVTPTIQGQFTPLPEALCDVIMDLTTNGQSVTIQNLCSNLETRFPHMTTPGIEIIYDTLAQLMQERKIYQTSKGYFIVTPEKRRSRSRPRNQSVDDYNGLEVYEHCETQEARTFLMTNSEALYSLYGEILTERDGDLTHQCIQTNLADVICGGNPSDKIMYPRTSKRRSSSFPAPRSLERRHSLRLFGSSKRLQRCSSTRSLSKTYAQSLATDSSSSEYQSTDSSSPRKGSLLFRLFRRSRRSKQRQVETYSGQFPPVEWFNSRTVHLQSVGTQTTDQEMPIAHTLSNSVFYDGSELSQQSSTLPKRHRRHLSSDSTFVISSRDYSPSRRNSSVYSSSSLPRSTQSMRSSLNVPDNSRISQQSSKISTSNSTSCHSSITKKYNTTSENTFKKNIFQEKNCHKSSSKHIGVLNSQSNDNNLQHTNTFSFEGRASSILNSSNIEHVRTPLNKTSNHSSLDSDLFKATKKQHVSPCRSILVFNRSPRSSPRHRTLKTGPNNSVLTESHKHENSLNTSTIKFQNNPHAINRSSVIPNSNSSIMLQVTTNSSQSNIPSTNIFVENSPVRSVITLENRKLLDSTKVYIINKETTNEKDELVKKTFSRQNSTPLKISSSIKLSSVFDNDANSEVYDPSSFVSETCKDQNDIISHPEKINSLKFSKNINNDGTMNNGRKLSLKPQQNFSNGIVYKNYLKNDLPHSTTNTEENFEKTVSVGNLEIYEKNSNDLNSKISSINDLKKLKFESVGNLNSKSRINTTVDSLTNVLQKNKITIGSENNLAIKNNEQRTRNANFTKAVVKNNVDNNFNSYKDNNEEIYDFPSLTDLSFNFTSLAAKKIMQGVSLNSTDNLVELNLSHINEKEKQQNNSVTSQSTFCTDYALL